jgi:hypothetical protein
VASKRPLHLLHLRNRQSIEALAPSLHECSATASHAGTVVLMDYIHTWPQQMADARNFTKSKDGISI